MMPAFKPGDHVLTFNWLRVSKGDVVVFMEMERAYFIKRIDRIARDLIYVSGDNNTRSAKTHPIKRRQIVGKVIFKY